jgi:hypothetical protein
MFVVGMLVVVVVVETNSNLQFHRIPWRDGAYSRRIVLERRGNADETRLGKETVDVIGLYFTSAKDNPITRYVLATTYVGQVGRIGDTAGNVRTRRGVARRPRSGRYSSSDELTGR